MNKDERNFLTLWNFYSLTDDIVYADDPKYFNYDTQKLNHILCRLPSEQAVDIRNRAKKYLCVTRFGHMVRTVSFISMMLTLVIATYSLFINSYTSEYRYIFLFFLATHILSYIACLCSLKLAVTINESNLYIEGVDPELIQRVMRDETEANKSETDS